MNALEMQNVGFSYSETEVIKDISFTVKQGEFVCLLGRNGSGKSTLAKLVNGLLIPKEGTVKVFGLCSSEQKNLFEIIPQSYPRIFIESQQQRLGKPYTNDYINLPLKEKIFLFLKRYSTIELYRLAKLFNRKIISSFCRLFRYVAQKF